MCDPSILGVVTHSVTQGMEFRAILELKLQYFKSRKEKSSWNLDVLSAKTAAKLWPSHYSQHGMQPVQCADSVPNVVKL